MLVKQKIFILLDRSGSMIAMWEQAISGINSYVEKLAHLNADIMMAVFDSGGYEVVRNTTTGEWKPLNPTEITARGGTPLLDAAGRIMWNMMDSKLDRAILVVVSDGEENASSKFKATEIKNMTKDLTTTYGYDIVFIGANFDGIQDVMRQNFGINDAGKFMASSATMRGFNNSMETTAVGTANYLAKGEAVSYTAVDKAKAKE